MMETYTDDLQEMPMSVFIMIYTGKGDRVKFRKGTDREAAIEKLVSSYNAIIGEKNIRGMVIRKSRYLNHYIRLNAAIYASRAVEENDTGYAKEILKMLGYSATADDVLKRRIASIIASESFALDREREKPQEQDKNPMTEADFIRERVALMRHYKMHIDVRTYSASEYAYLVKGFCDEIESLKRQRELMKVRRR